MASLLEKEREGQLLREIPDVLNYKTLLYVGAKPERIQMVELFFLMGYAIDALEAWRPNVDRLENWNRTNRIFRKIIQGNIRSDQIPEKYDIVMFWHGPEHLQRDDLPLALINAEIMATRLVIFASPWGLYRQGGIDGNPFEKHISHFYPIDYEKYGYKTSTLGRKDVKGSNLLAWKRIGPEETKI